MENKKNRVVLNLTTNQAKMLSAAMQNIAESYHGELCQESELATTIHNRIEKTIIKQRILREHPEFKGAQLRTALQFALTGKDAVELEVTA